MKPSVPHFRPCLAIMASSLAFASAALADVTLSAVSSSGSTVLQPGATFDVNLTWTGTPMIAAADYAVTLNTSQLVLTGRTFHAGLATFADAPYLASLPAAANRIDITWFKESRFVGNDVTLHFQVPLNYTGPAAVTVGLVVDGIQDDAAENIAATTVGTTVNLAPIGPLTGTNTTTGAQSALWSALTWTGATPNGNGDIANFIFTSDQNITLDVPVTLGRLSCTGTGQYNLIRSGTNALTFDNTNTGAVASVLMTRIGSDATGRRIDANVILNSDLVATWARIQGGTTRTHGVRGVVSGPGRLSMNYGIAPAEGPDTGTTINLNGTGATAAHQIHLGLAGDPANTHAGGTDLRAGNSTFGTVKFLANKLNALGTAGTAGRLSMHQAALDMSTFNQSTGGLTGGTGGAKIGSTSSSAGTTTLTVDFADTGGPYLFSGVIMDGAGTGVGGAVRTVALTKSGTGTQTLSGSNSFTGPTRITGGSLLVTGSLAVGSEVMVLPGGTLGGTGTVSGPTTSQGTIAPGASVGGLNMGAVTLDADSNLEIEVSDWASTTPGTGWDHLNCASLSLAGTPADKIGVKVLPLSLAAFSETPKTLRIATAAMVIGGFAADSISVNGSEMPGTGTWSVQPDAGGLHLELLYTPGSEPPASAYDTWAEDSGLDASNDGATLDPDKDGRDNFTEFAFHGDPLDGANNGLFFHRRADTTADPDALSEMVLTLAVRRGADFSPEGVGARVSGAVDGVIYKVAAGGDLGSWAEPVTHVGASDTPPPGSGLPDLAGSGWQYRTFSAFNGLPDRGFLRAVATAP